MPYTATNDPSDLYDTCQRMAADGFIIASVHIHYKENDNRPLYQAVFQRG